MDFVGSPGLAVGLPRTLVDWNAARPYIKWILRVTDVDNPGEARWPDPYVVVDFYDDQGKYEQQARRNPGTTRSFDVQLRDPGKGRIEIRMWEDDVFNADDDLGTLVVRRWGTGSGKVTGPDGSWNYTLL
ncbi:C2 domain-containing protein [Streptomyces sp. NPDC127051]|uniref:C2 domain-containing protein n=1 Tax=Streptomyces sp. NPDC127051 TaxID=3347119 RepID=UPI00365B8B06